MPELPIHRIHLSANLLAASVEQQQSQQQGNRIILALPHALQLKAPQPTRPPRGEANRPKHPTEVDLV